VFRRILAAAAALTLLTAGIAFVAAPADAARKASFRLTVYDASACSECTPPFTRAQGERLVLSARTISDGSRPAVVQSLSGGKWHVIKHKPISRGSTRFFHITHASVGHYAIRAVAPRYHGHKRLVSNTISWTVLLKTTVSGVFSANPAPTKTDIVVSGQLAPAAVRDVAIRIVDSRVGGNISWSDKSNPDGTYAISIPLGPAGTYSYRVEVGSTDTAAQGNFRLPTLVVR
jgi:hypothetical protein